MGFVAPVDPTTATVISTTTFGRPVVDAINAMANPAAAQMYQTTATTTLTSGTYGPIGFDTELADTVNGHSTVSNTARYVCQTGWAGRYLVSGVVGFQANATGARFAAIGVNGIVPQAGSVTGWVTVPNSSAFYMPTTAEVILTVGDYVQLLGLQSSGGTLPTVIGAGTSSMSVRWVAAA